MMGSTSPPPVVLEIKKYPNRRLYDATRSCHVTLGELYDLVIIDAPVLLSVSDGLILAAKAEATVIVHKPGTLDKRALERMRADLDMAGANVLGVVFNQVDRRDRYVYPAYMESPYVGEEKSRPRGRSSRRGAHGKG